MTRLTCPDCGLPLRVELQGCKPRRVNSEIMFTAHMTIVTCDFVACKRCGITREVSAFYRMSDDEVARYPRVGVGS